MRQVKLVIKASLLQLPPVHACSKLCNQVFTYELARRLAQAGSPVTCNALDPGTVNTKMLLAGWGPMGIEASGR